MTRTSKSIIIFALIIVGSGFFYSWALNQGFLNTIAESETQNILQGWAWSSNIGWISFCGTGGASGGGSTYDIGVQGWKCPNNPLYEVKIDPFTGEMNGYAWASNIGWIKFDPVGPYPSSGPNYSAKVVTVTVDGIKRRQVRGWIRACSPIDEIGVLPTECDQPSININGGDWDGWIKMSGGTSNCPYLDADPASPTYNQLIRVVGGPAQPYETCITAPDPAFPDKPISLEGYAWGGGDPQTSVVGWIQFNPKWASVGIPPSSTPICEIRPDGTSICP